MKYFSLVMCALFAAFSLCSYADDTEEGSGAGAGPEFEVACYEPETTSGGIGTAVVPHGGGLLANVYEMASDTPKDLGTWPVEKTENGDEISYADKDGKFQLKISRRQARSKGTLQAEGSDGTISKALECDFGST